MYRRLNQLARRNQSVSVALNESVSPVSGSVNVFGRNLEVNCIVPIYRLIGDGIFNVGA